MKRLLFQLKAAHISFWLAVALFLGACSLIGGGDDDPADGNLLFGQNVTLTAGQGFLICTPECSARGFCGSLESGARVVLLSSPLPSTQIFTQYGADNSAVTIGDLQTHDAVLRSNQAQPVPGVNFYLVSNEAIPPAWAAGWCVGQAPPQQ